MKPDRGPDDFDDLLLALFAAIASRDHVGVTRMLDQTPGLVTLPFGSEPVDRIHNRTSSPPFVTTSTPATLSLSVYFHATDEELAEVGDDDLLSEAFGVRGVQSTSEEHLRLWSPRRGPSRFLGSNGLVPLSDAGS